MYLGPYQRPAQPCQLHSATAQQSPQGSSMRGLCAVVGIGTTAVLHSVLKSILTNTDFHTAQSWLSWPRQDGGLS